MHRMKGNWGLLSSQRDLKKEAVPLPQEAPAYVRQTSSHEESMKGSLLETSPGIRMHLE